MSPANASSAAQSRSILLMLIAATLFAMMDSASKYLVHHYPVLGLVWVRYMVQTVFMIVVLGPRMGFDLLRTTHIWLHVARAFLLLGITVLYINGLRFMPLAEASALIFIAPLLTTLLSRPLLGEKIKPARWVAVLVGFCGVLVILRPGGSLFALAALLPLGAAVCYSFYQIITRQLSVSENAFTSLFYTAIIGMAAMSITLPFSWAMPVSAFDAFMMVMLGVFGGIGHFLVIKALDNAAVSTVAPFTYSQLVWAVLFGYFIFGEFPDHWAFVGMGVIALSGLYVVYDERYQGRQDAMK